MAGQLDGHASLTTAPRVDQHALAGAEPCDLDQSLPRRQRNQRKRGGLFKRHVGGFEGGSAIAHCRKFRERSNSVLVHARIDRIAFLEARHP
jgi:hypothetical protein